MGMFRSSDLATLLRQEMPRAHRAKAASVWIPLKTVNPLNGREHWSARHRRVKEERRMVALHLAAVRLPEPPVLVTMTRFGKLMDDDGLAAATKGLQDEIAQQLGVDDGDRAKVRWVRKQVQWSGSPAVHVTIKQRRTA